MTSEVCDLGLAQHHKQSRVKFLGCKTALLSQYMVVQLCHQTALTCAWMFTCMEFNLYPAVCKWGSRHSLGMASLMNGHQSCKHAFDQPGHVGSPFCKTKYLPSVSNNRGILQKEQHPQHYRVRCLRCTCSAGT